jgi:hypothetical protein
VYELPAVPGFATPSAAGVVDNSLMLTTDVALLEQVIRADKDEQPLVDSPAYRRVAQYFPSRTSLLGFQKQDAHFAAVYEMFRTGDTTMPGLDASKLPPFSDIKKYLPPTGIYAIPDERGALYVTFTLKNPNN